MGEIKALARGLDVLDYLLEQPARADLPKEVSVTEVAARLGVDKSTASRILSTLAAHGYVRRAEGTRSYLLGPKFHGVRASRGALRDLARPFLYHLMRATGECAHIALYTQGHALITDDVESAASLRVAGGVGRSEALHCTAVGKCLLAFMRLPLPDALPKRTARTITTRAALEAEMARIRTQGYALDDEENYEGVRCLAAPLFDHTGLAVACVGISGPSVRMTPSSIPDLARRVMETSRDLSHVLGFVGAR